MYKVKIVICTKHGNILFGGACELCRNEKLDKILGENLQLKKVIKKIRNKLIRNNYRKVLRISVRFCVDPIRAYKHLSKPSLPY